MKTKHTPGPWKVVETDNSLFVQGNKCNIAGLYSGLLWDKNHMEENARLIAAAPDLYESIVGLLTWIQTECTNLPRPDDAWGKIVMFRSQAAITKAGML